MLLPHYWKTKQKGFECKNATVDIELVFEGLGYMDNEPLAGWVCIPKYIVNI